MGARLMPLPEFTQIYLFIGACLALVAIPGPAVAFIVARGVSEGTKAAVRTAAGIAVGNLSQALAAAFGLAALLVSYPSVYLWIKYAGASYLIYLGLRSFFVKANPRASSNNERNSPSFRQGALVGLLNPKVALFLLAFLPQFTSPENGELWLPLLYLGFGFVFIGWLGDSTWALFAGLASARLRRNNGLSWGRYAAGIVYCAVGITTALWSG